MASMNARRKVSVRHGTFCQRLAASVTSFNLRFKVLCSSRPENAIEPKFGIYSRLKIQDFTAEDIRKFVGGRLEEVVHNLHPDDGAIGFGHKLIGEIVSKAEAVFIWARLVFAELIMVIEDGGDDSILGLLGNISSSKCTKNHAAGYLNSLTKWFFSS